MKSVLMTLAVTVLSSAAFANAADLSCVDVNQQSDDGYSVTFGKNKTVAILEQETIGGPQVVARLKCVTDDSQSSFPDGQTVISCAENKRGDTGYRLTVEEGGFGGLSIAHLYQENLGGGDEVAVLKCN